MEGSKFPYLKDTSLSDWCAQLGGKLECPVCLKTFTDSPVFVCENQHALCSMCHTRLKAENKGCPQCRGRLTNKRNLVVEGILDTLPKKKCKYECDFKKTDSDLVKEHEEHCLAKPVPCGGCKEKIPMRDISKHIMKNHQPRGNSIMKSANALILDLSDLENHGWSFQHPIKELGKNFIFNLTEVDEKYVLLWISYCGSPKEAKKYNYEFQTLERNVMDPEIEDDDENVEVLSFHKSKCVSCELSFQEIKEHPQGAAVFTKEFLKSAEVVYSDNEADFLAVAIDITKQ